MSPRFQAAACASMTARMATRSFWDAIPSRPAETTMSSNRFIDSSRELHHQIRSAPFPIAPGANQRHILKSARQFQAALRPLTDVRLEIGALQIRVALAGLHHQRAFFGDRGNADDLLGKQLRLVELDGLHALTA